LNAANYAVTETNTCLLPDENWLEVSQDRQIRTVKAVRGSLSSIDYALYSSQISHDESRDEETLSTCSSSISLHKENFVLLW